MTEQGRDPRHPDQDLHDLQLLDPAHGTTPASVREPAAQALLARILEEPRRIASADGTTSTRDRQRWRRWTLAAAAAAAVVAALVIVPPWGAPEHAFATWTPDPEPASADELGDVAAQCTTGRSSTPMWDRDAVIAEERGRITFVVALGTTMVHHCLLVDGQFFSSGSSNIDLGPQDVDPDDAWALQAVGSGTANDAHTTVTGRVGRDVVGVELHPGEPVTIPGQDEPGPDVELPEPVTASLDDGYFGAWWPGESHDFTLTIHLADGSTRTEVPGFTHDRED